MKLLTLVEKLESDADQIFTPLCDGKMVWHLWGSGTPLVLLHGGSGSWSHWVKNIEELSKHYRLLVPDLPGLGDSDNPPFFFDPKDYATSIPKLAETISSSISKILGDTAFHLCQLGSTHHPPPQLVSSITISLKNITAFHFIFYPMIIYIDFC